tara:strand:- start:771 stop:1112 length:342 start_codon:yes stop_codon:yes gene_type:complete
MAISLEEALQAKAALDQQELDTATPLLVGLPATAAGIVGADVAGTGRRFAGGLIGAILGGALGAVQRQKAAKSAETAPGLLAKLKTGQELSIPEQAQLEQQLKAYYMMAGRGA